MSCPAKKHLGSHWLRFKNPNWIGHEQNELLYNTPAHSISRNIITTGFSYFAMCLLAHGKAPFAHCAIFRIHGKDFVVCYFGPWQKRKSLFDAHSARHNHGLCQSWRIYELNWRRLHFLKHVLYLLSIRLQPRMINFLHLFLWGSENVPSS